MINTAGMDRRERGVRSLVEIDCGLWYNAVPNDCGLDINFDKYLNGGGSIFTILQTCGLLEIHGILLKVNTTVTHKLFVLTTTATQLLF